MRSLREARFALGRNWNFRVPHVCGDTYAHFTVASGGRLHLTPHEAASRKPFSRRGSEFVLQSEIVS